jgi:hypothetical protein
LFDGETVQTARKLIEVLDAKEIVVEDLHASVATLFEGEAALEPEHEPEASPSATST